MSTSKYTYEELPEGVSTVTLCELREDIKTSFLNGKTLGVFNGFKKAKPAGGSFQFRDQTVEEMTTYFQEKYPIQTKRLVMLVLLGYDALPQGDAPRLQNMTHFLPEGVKKSLKDELVDMLTEKFEGIVCTYPVIAHPKPNRTNFCLVIHYGKEAKKRQAEMKQRQTEKAALRAEKLAAAEAEATPASGGGGAAEPAMAEPATAEAACLQFAQCKGEDIKGKVEEWVFNFACENSLSPEQAAELSDKILAILASDCADNCDKRFPASPAVAAGE